MTPFTATKTKSRVILCRHGDLDIRHGAAGSSGDGGVMGNNISSGGGSSSVRWSPDKTTSRRNINTMMDGITVKEADPPPGKITVWQVPDTEMTIHTTCTRTRSSADVSNVVQWMVSDLLCCLQQHQWMKNHASPDWSRPLRNKKPHYGHVCGSVHPVTHNNTNTNNSKQYLCLVPTLIIAL